ncbi:MAG TPA: hypothetical protein DCE18_18480 [Syntrophobacteraceae bacterium]|nr:hypothetical protein [Syntrophobacteraceae bacterium]HBZ55587.1 hypothetical protein [Syntrophobacteraceae bacterium]
MVSVVDMIRSMKNQQPVQEIRPSSGAIPRYRCLLICTVLVLGFGASLILDRAVYQHFCTSRYVFQDWYRLLRVSGFLPLWLFVAVAWMLIDGEAAKTVGLLRACSRGVLLSASVLGCGLLAEILKLLIRRERPSLHDGYHYFSPWQSGLWDNSMFGLPSSHSSVAFAATWALCYLYPRAWPMWLMLGLGCAVTRLLERAHFLSDVYMAAVMSWIVVWLLWRLLDRYLPSGGGCHDANVRQTMLK